MEAKAVAHARDFNAYIPRIRRLIVLLVCLICLPFARAATLTWTGNAGDGLVATPGNWNLSQVPASGDLLIFAGTNSLLAQLSLGLPVGSLTFNNTAGAFTLAGAGTYVINAGGIANNSASTETINNAITLGAAQTWNAVSGNLVFGGNIANGAFLLTIGGSSNTSASGIISGTGGLTKSGTGILTLIAANTYSGATSITAGILNVQNASGLGSTTAGTTVSSGATLQLQGGITVGAEALTVSGTGASGQNGALVNVSGTNNYGGLLTLGAATTVSSDAGTLNLTNTGTITGATFGLTLTGAGNGTISSIIGTTTGTMTKSGSGTWTLTGANTYTGATTISAGALNIQSAAALGTTANGTTVSGGAALQIQGGITVGSEALTLNGSGVSTDGALRNISGTNSMSGAVSLGSAATIGSDAGTLTLSGALANGGFLLTETGAGNITLSGVMSGTGGLTMNGSGTLTLSGASANTYSGTTTVNSGVLLLNKSATTNAYAGSLVIGDEAGTDEVRWGANNQAPATAITVTSSGLMNLNAFSDTIGALTIESGTSSGGSLTTGVGVLTLGGNITLNVNGTGATGATISGNVKDGAVRTITVNDGNADADLTISAVLQGTKGFIKTGAGRLVLSGANTDSAAFTISGGPVQLQNASAINSFTSTTVSAGGALEFIGGIAFNGDPVTINSDGVSSTGAILNVSGNNSFAGAITLASASTIESAAGTLTLSSTIGNGGFLLTEGGAGNVTASGVISGNGGLTKTDSGTLTLSGGSANTYTGVTTVNNGELDLNKTAGVNAFAGTLTVGDSTGAADSAVTKLLASNQIPNITVTVNGDGLLNLNDFSDAISALTMTGGDVTTGTGTLTLGGTVTGNAASTSATISGNLALGANRIFAIADGSAAQDMSISAVVSGAFTVTKNGLGTMVFSGANSYSAATTVSAGVLDIQNATGLGTTAAGTTVSSGATLALEGGITVGAETLNIAGTGASGQTGALVNVTGTNSYGGLLTLAAATTLSSDSGTLSLTNSGTITGATFGLTLAGAGDGSIASIIGTTSGSVTKNGAGTWTLTGVNTYTGGTTINAGTLAVNSFSSMGATSGGLTINAGTLEITSGFSTTRTMTLGDAASTFQVDPSQTYTVTTAIGGTGSLNKTGSGTMVLGATETYSGATNVSAGTLQLNASNRIPDASAVTVSGGTLDVQTFTDTVGSVTLSGGAITGTGTGALTASSYSLQSGSASAILAGSGIVVNKTTSGTVTLTGANTYTGGTNINGGTLNVGSSGALGSSGTISFGGGTLQYSASNTTDYSNRFSAGPSQAFKIDTNGQNVTLGAAISSAGGTFYKTGSGTLTLSGANSYTGATSIAGGTLQVNVNNALGTNAAGTAVSSGAALKLNGVNYSTTEGLTLNGTGVSNGGALTNTGTSTFAGAINIATNATINAGGGTLNLTGGIAKNGTTLTLAGGGTININTTGITGSASNSDLVVDGTTVNLNTANSYNGPTTIQNSGTLNLGASNVLPSSPQTDMTVNTSSVFNLASYSDGVASLAGDSTATVKNSAVGTTSTLTVNPSSGSTTFAGVIAGTAGGTQGNVALVKSGAGTLVLTGANTFSSATTVSGGTLTAAASSGSALGSTSSVTVNLGGTLLLGAADQINNSASMSLGGGTFAKGNFSEGATNAVGIGALTLSASSTIDFSTGTVGTLSFASLNASSFTLTIDNWTGVPNQAGTASTDRLIFDSDQSGNLSRFAFTGYGPSSAMQFSLPGGYYEVVAAVPEPGTWAPATATFALLVAYGLRRYLVSRRKNSAGTIVQAITS